MLKNDPILISEDNPLVVGSLVVYPSKLEYKGIRCNFLDIEHIGWYWLSQTINFVNTQNVRLNIYIKGLKKPISINKTTMYVTPKLVTAYNFIAKQTFHIRLSFYTSQLEQTGGFTYDNCNIYSDGRVISKGNTFSLSNAEIETFDIKIKQGGWLGPKVKISLDIDRDVILALIDFILRNPQDPFIYVENHKKQKEAEENSSYFLRDIVSLMAKLSSSDGRVNPEEVDIIKSFLLETMQLDKEAYAQAVSIFNDAKTSPKPFEFFAESLLSRFKNDKNMLSGILDLLFSIAIADGILSAEEELLILEAESIFCVKGASYNEFKQNANDFTDSIDEYYLNVLGLSSGAAQSEIKSEYRRLVMKFHPDRVHHLGEDFVRQAETKMKEINEAYDYLSK